MRDIKFRAFCKISKDMFPVLTWYWDEDMIQTDDDVYSVYNIKKFEIMQFTGLKDKNGVEIYEGDLLRYRQDIYQDEFLEVKFQDGQFIAESSNDRQSLTNQNIDDLEVVGNVYENPKLMETQDE